MLTEAAGAGAPPCAAWPELVLRQRAVRAELGWKWGEVGHPPQAKGGEGGFSVQTSGNSRPVRFFLKH